MNKEEYINKLRMYLADPQGVIWSDTELSAIIDDAFKQYCIDSGMFVGRFDFFPDKNGQYTYPEDYASFVIGWNKKGEEIKAADSITLFDKQRRNLYRSGDAEYIYSDQSETGKFALYPTPGNKQNVKSAEMSSIYGEINGSGYGTYITEEYGITQNVNIFDFAGDFYYNKIGSLKDVKDYMAVIFGAMHIAYNADSDLGNADTALFWKNQYKNRINAFGRIKNQNNGKSRTINFY